MFDLPISTTAFDVLPVLRHAYHKALEGQGGQIREGMKIHLVCLALGFTAGSLAILHALHGGATHVVVIEEAMIAITCFLVDLSCLASFGLWGSAYNAFARADRQILPVMFPEEQPSADAILAESFAFSASEWELIFFVASLPSRLFRNRNLLLFFRHKATKQLILLENARTRHGFHLLSRGDLTGLMLKHTLCTEYAKNVKLENDHRLCPYLTQEQMETLYMEIFQHSIRKDAFSHD